LLRENKYKSWVSTRAVLDMAGDVQQTFDHLDTNSDGQLDLNELKALLRGIELPAKEDEVEKLMIELDKNNNGKVDFAEFASWYIGSAERIRRDINNLFDEYDKERKGYLEKSEVVALLVATRTMKANEIEDVVKELFTNQGRDCVAKDQFYVWYDASDLFKKHIKESKDAEDLSRGFKQLLYCPDGCFQKFWYFLTLPLMMLFYCTMVDVRQVGKFKYCYFTFLMSIIWIGVFAYFMVG
jgi:calmodulin